MSDKESENELPIVIAHANHTHWIVVRCPYCNEEHSYVHEDWDGNTMERLAHCIGGRFVIQLIYGGLE